MALTIVTCSTKKWSLISLKMEFLSYFPFDSHYFSVSSHLLCFERWGSFSLSLKFNPSTLRVDAYGEWGHNSCESFPLTLPITSPIPASFLPHFLLLSFHLSLIFLPCFLLFIFFDLFLYSMVKPRPLLLSFLMFSFIFCPFLKITLTSLLFSYFQL